MLFVGADRAALLRGVSPWEVRGFYLFKDGYPDFSPKILELSAPLVAEVREETNDSIGKALHGKLSEHRMRRLLSARHREDLVTQLRRAVRILGRKANPDDLVATVAYWGDKRRRQLAQDYFQPEPEVHDDTA